VQDEPDEPPADPTSHCAQGVLRLQGQVTDVLSGSAGIVSESPQSPAATPTTGTPGTGGAPVSVTG
jgi:hypothetical protein